MFRSFAVRTHFYMVLCSLSVWSLHFPQVTCSVIRHITGCL